MNPKGKKSERVVDLDEFLNIQTWEPTGQIPEPSDTAVMPESDRMAVVGMLIDNSGSMDGLEQSVLDGLNLGIESLKGAKGSDFYLDIRSFTDTIFKGPITQFNLSRFKYIPNLNHTPLVGTSTKILKDLHKKAEQYRNLGIPTTVALLIVTDGQPTGEDREESTFNEFRKEIKAGDYIVGMGITRNNNESAVTMYRDTFSGMRTTKTVTPMSNPTEIRRAMNQFSQSVASIATGTPPSPSAP